MNIPSIRIDGSQLPMRSLTLPNGIDRLAPIPMYCSLVSGTHAGSVLHFGFRLYAGSDRNIYMSLSRMLQQMYTIQIADEFFEVLGCIKWHADDDRMFAYGEWVVQR